MSLSPIELTLTPPRKTLFEERFSVEELIKTSSLPDGELKRKLDSIFSNEEIIQQFYKPKNAKKWLELGFHLYESNPDKFILCHKELNSIILKIVNPNYLNDDEESKLLVKLNLSRVYMANKIRNIKRKFIEIPKKYIYYISGIQQYIVVVEKIQTTESIEEQMSKLKMEQVDELFEVCEKVEFQDLAPRNLRIVNEKVYMIDTEDYFSYESEMKRLGLCTPDCNSPVGDVKFPEEKKLKRRSLILHSFQNFSENLPNDISKKFDFSKKLKFLNLCLWFGKTQQKEDHLLSARMSPRGEYKREE